VTALFRVCAAIKRGLPVTVEGGSGRRPYRACRTEEQDCRGLYARPVKAGRMSRTESRHMAGPTSWQLAVDAQAQLDRSAVGMQDPELTSIPAVGKPLSVVGAEHRTQSGPAVLAVGQPLPRRHLEQSTAPSSRSIWPNRSRSRSVADTPPSCTAEPIALQVISATNSVPSSRHISFEMRSACGCRRAREVTPPKSQRAGLQLAARRRGATTQHLTQRGAD
jgi:hypothetical protein